MINNEQEKFSLKKEIIITQKMKILTLFFIICLSVKSKQQQSSISNSDLIINDSESVPHSVLEAYKSSLNDKILKEKDPINYSQLKWFSYGSPRLITINNTVLSFSSRTLMIHVQMLTNEHKKLFANQVKKQYKIDIEPDQIKDIIPAAFECLLNIKCYEEFQLKGKVKNLREFPLRVDFDIENKQKECLENIEQEELTFECRMALANAKQNSSVLERTFSLWANQSATIQFDQTLLERIKSLEANLKLLSDKINLNKLAARDSNTSNLTINSRETNKTTSKLNIFRREPTFKGIKVNYLFSY